MARRHRAEIVEAVARSLELPDSELPERLTNTPSPPRTLMSFVAALLESLCDDHEIDSQLLASHADVREADQLGAPIAARWRTAAAAARGGGLASGAGGRDDPGGAARVG